MSYQYCQEARDRISAFGQNKVAEFIDEIPQVFRKAFYDRQPAISGFRSGSPSEFKEKQKRLIGHVVNPQGGQKSEADWKTFANFWIAWAKSHIGEDFPAGDRSLPADDAGPLLLRTLADQFPDVPRETIERLISFSGFADHVDTQVALGRFRPASTLARDRMVDELPGRLSKIEGYFEIAEAAADEVTERIDLLFSKVSSFIQGLDEAALSAMRSSEDLAELRLLVEKMARSSEQLAERLRTVDEITQVTAEAVAVSDRNALLMRQNLNEISDRAKGWEDSLVQFSKLNDLTNHISLLDSEWAKIVETVALLSDRFEAFQVNISKVHSDSDSDSDSGSSQNHIRLFESEPQGPIVEIHTVEVACELISRNLQACGIVKGSAILVARQILAALAAGQLVQFSGSLADLVVDSVAAAIGGPIFHEWRVPVGLISDEVAAECLEMVADTSGCLVLKGANRSAFEIYGYALRDVVARRQLSTAVHLRLVFIASWAHGPAAFPDGGTLAELGPVFDTDAWPMRAVSSTLPALKYGYLKCDSWSQLKGFDDDISSAVVTDLKDLLKEANFIPGNLWMRSAERAYLRLRVTPGAVKRTTCTPF
ncbi:hypothetical protein PSm6_00940 [Pseudomonas solani]|uniref:Uncharacterized protein n=1 Tax=Pseudomonas solani TaxID=2731552 RepID=A0ABN6BKL0_9PSED|nr:hypothetical protein [Pseudomonas solani]BCD83687.1 hypothetical protein PSm6_00940 [Pseudomonas solani]